MLIQSPSESMLQVVHMNVSKTWAMLSSCQQQQSGELQPAAALQMSEFPLFSIMLRLLHITSVHHAPSISVPSFVPPVPVSLSYELSCIYTMLRLVLSFMHLGICCSWAKTGSNTLVANPIREVPYTLSYICWRDIWVRLFSLVLNICLCILVNQSATFVQ